MALPVLRSRPTHRARPVRFFALAFVALGSLIGAALSLTLGFAPISAPAEQVGGNGELPRRSRRETLAAGVAASVSAGLIAPPPAVAEVAWQLKQPRDWQIFSQTPQPPPGDMKPAALVVAGRPDAGGELVVLRVPLDTSGGSPNAAAAKNLVGFFSSPSTAKVGDAVEAVASSQRSAPTITKFDLVGGIEERVSSGRRYVRYDYDSLVCPGVITKGSKGNICGAPDNGEEILQQARRHAITFTVINEANPSGATTPVLWLVDISAPSEAWPYAQATIADLEKSFEVGNADQLEKDRDAYRQQLNAEIAKLNATEATGNS